MRKKRLKRNKRKYTKRKREEKLIRRKKHQKIMNPPRPLRATNLPLGKVSLPRQKPIRKTKTGRRWCQRKSLPKSLNESILG